MLIGRQKQTQVEPEHAFTWDDIETLQFQKIHLGGRGNGPARTHYQIEIQTHLPKPIIWGPYLDEKHVLFLYNHLLQLKQTH